MNAGRGAELVASASVQRLGSALVGGSVLLVGVGGATGDPEHLGRGHAFLGVCAHIQRNAIENLQVHCAC